MLPGLRRLKIIGAPARTLQKSSVENEPILNSQFSILIREAKLLRYPRLSRIGIENWELIRFPELCDIFAALASTNWEKRR